MAPECEQGGVRWILMLSAVLGLGLAWWLYPAGFLWPQAGGPWRPVGDAAQHAVAQRYFLASPWQWPPLDVTLLSGLNLAFMDGIPLLALPLKLAAPLLPPGFHGIGLWYALCWVALPASAAWALRGTGETRTGPLLAVALAAMSMPAFIMRFGHAALCGHFLLWLALGLYLRLVAGRRLWPAAAGLQVAALLVHPYLAVMTLAVLAAVPLTLACRGTAARRAMLGLAAALGSMLLVMAGFGYLSASGDGQRFYGAFAMNLLSPFWPFRSWFLGAGIAAEIDATGHGGWEGYNWLGLGLWLAIALLVILRPRAVLAGLVAHGGLVLACLGLTALAITHRVGLGSATLELFPAPGFLEQFRASGRFFWPVGAALLLGAAALLARQGRAGVALLTLCAVIQFIDAAPARQALHDWARTAQPWRVDAAALRPLLARAERVVLLPAWPCIAADDHAAREALLEMLALASETPRPINTMYAARWPGGPPPCLPPGPPQRGELRLEWEGGWRVTATPR